MRIAIWHNLGSGGGKRALYSHVQGLIENGHYLEAWTTDMSSEYLSLSNLIIENRKSIKSKFELIQKTKNAIRKEQKLIELLTDHCKECIIEIESGNFDLIFANSCFITYMPYIAMFTKIPSIVYLGEPHRFLYEAAPDNIWQAPFIEFKFIKVKAYLKEIIINYSRRIKVRHEIEAAKSYKKILVNSLFSRENIIRAYGIDSNVCYLGIDLDKFVTTNSKKDHYVVGIGSITFLKSVHQAIEIISKISKEKRPVLKWIGNIIDEIYLNEVILLAKRLEVDFQFFINISDNELIKIVSQAAIMIYSPRLEPFGLAPLEANACGTYVVAVAEGGVRESIVNGINGTLINGFKVEEIADVISQFIGDLNYAKDKGDNARVFVQENWGRNIMTQNILSEIENLVIR